MSERTMRVCVASRHPVGAASLEAGQAPAGSAPSARTAGPDAGLRPSLREGWAGNRGRGPHGGAVRSGTAAGPQSHKDDDAMDDATYQAEKEGLRVVPGGEEPRPPEPPGRRPPPPDVMAEPRDVLTAVRALRPLLGDIGTWAGAILSSLEPGERSRDDAVDEAAMHARALVGILQQTTEHVKVLGWRVATVEARLSYVAPVYSEDKRSALARAVVSNNGSFWRPGTFIRALVPVEIADSSLTVERAAVQTFEDLQVVFVPGEEDGEFELVAVETGFTSEDAVEIVSGLHNGDAYVASGAFELKAKMVTANLGDHAGHGH